MDDSKALELARARIAQLQAELDGAFVVVAYAALQAGELRVPRSALVENHYEVITELDPISLEQIFRARLRVTSGAAVERRGETPERNSGIPK
jgi:hypothetical protein